MTGESEATAPSPYDDASLRELVAVNVFVKCGGGGEAAVRQIMRYLRVSRKDAVAMCARFERGKRLAEADDFKDRAYRLRVSEDAGCLREHIEFLPSVTVIDDGDAARGADIHGVTGDGAVKLKFCTKCRGWGSVSDFPPRRASADGLAYWCNPCMRAYKREYMRMRKRTAVEGTASIRRGRRKLTPEIVRDCRERYKTGNVTYQQLADEFGVSRSAIFNAVNGRGGAWENLDN